jgi:hypothetical protein
VPCRTEALADAQLASLAEWLLGSTHCAGREQWSTIDCLGDI